jgi:uncharacterized protein (DUF433 family)
MEHVGIIGMSSEQVARLTGLTLRQLGYWGKTEFFSPEYAPGYPFGPFSRVYSFRDVVGLYAIARLRRKFPLQQLRAVGAYLQRNHDAPWSTLVLGVCGRDVAYQEPGSPGVWISTLRNQGQQYFPISLEVVARRVEDQVQRFQQRRPNQIGRVQRHRYVVHNAPVLAGTRVPTSAVWNLYQAGYDRAAILAEYPRLQEADVRAALRYEERRRRKAG